MIQNGLGVVSPAPTAERCQGHYGDAVVFAGDAQAVVRVGGVDSEEGHEFRRLTRTRLVGALRQKLERPLRFGDRVLVAGQFDLDGITRRVTSAIYGESQCPNWSSSPSCSSNQALNSKTIFYIISTVQAPIDEI